MCAYFSIVILHYMTVFFFTKNWTYWLTFVYSVSVIKFAPFQIVIYDSLGGDLTNNMTGRLKEIAFSDF